MESLVWSPDALAMLRNIPFFVRSQARRRIEQLARERNMEIVTAALVQEARTEFGQ